MSVKLHANAAQFEAWLSERANRQPEIVRAWKDEGKLLVMEEMRGRTPIRRGFLRESITAAETPDGFIVYPTAKYAEYVERGTGPHDIFPRSFITKPAKGFRGEIFFRKGGVLHWTDKWGGDIFATHVHHPGFAGRWFAKKTYDTVKLELKQLFREIIVRFFK